MVISSHSLAEEPEFFGFRPESVAEQRELEKRYDALLRKENLREWMKSMTTRPHHAGSPKARENAEFTAELFRSWGYDTEIEVFHVLFPTPKTRELELLEPNRYRAKLIETVFEDRLASHRQGGFAPLQRLFGGR